MALLTEDLRKLADPKGFYEKFCENRTVLGNELAYEETERMHIAIYGSRRYENGYSTFERVYKRYDAHRLGR
ncbi:hypothetical protein [Larkinella humicola]|uniref:Uncharacterized protein n=1 Tax=Larkinella humicola TaxID=2607654 RepID=A0A5N1JNN6_9BACT|nr:hypothetical protein [Larkinella humicola]KAA9357226.1 hypothetical protein F0P93_05680 [Larkinella humicola]